MDEVRLDGLVRFAEAVDKQTTAVASLLETMADSIARLESTVGRLDAEMAELRDQLYRYATRMGGQP